MGVGSLDLLQICIRRRASENSQHRHNLALMMKCVRDDMQENKCRAPEFAAPIPRTLGQDRVKLLFAKVAQINSGRLSYSVFGSDQCGDRCAIVFVPAD